MGSDHKDGCPAKYDKEATCTCGFIPPELREISLEDAVKIFGVDTVVDMIDRYQLVPMTTRPAFWVASSVVLPGEE